MYLKVASIILKLAQLKLCFIAIVLTVLNWLKTPETKDMAKKRAQKSLKKVGTKFQSSNRLTKDSMVLRKQGKPFKIMLVTVSLLQTDNNRNSRKARNCFKRTSNI